MQRAFSLIFLTACLLVAAPSLAQSDPDPGRTADYAVGIEDELRVFIWGEQDLSAKVRVRPDGKITVPLVNDIYVVGLSTDEIREKIREALLVYMNEPVVTVIVDAIRSYQVYFLGEVKKQGVINFYRPPRLLQAIAAAGGLSEFASNDIVLLRETGGRETRTQINYKKLISGDASAQNFYLKPGDTLLFKK